MQKLVIVINGAESGDVLERWVFNVETDKDSLGEGWVILIFLCRRTGHGGECKHVQVKQAVEKAVSQQSVQITPFQPSVRTRFKPKL